ncbi:MAG: TIGR03986 family CRISPR-associated RAMP protein [Oscillospiraceae bacterium]|nr:TIGR03986 family CRISPR-associated RAMP protein [Oscillospiraceae bacterium]
MAMNERVHAPYNFVPFSEKLLLPYGDEKALPPHDVLDPELKTGEIDITLTAETPVFVSDGNKGSPRFFRLPDGRFGIPGSTLRGLIRENMQILGFGLVRPGEDLEDYRVYFRAMAYANGSVKSNPKNYYSTVLDIQTRRSPESGKSYSTPANVRSGYLHCEGGSCFIYPTVEPFMRVSRKSEDVKRFGAGDARTIPVGFLAGDGRVKKLVPADEAGAGMRRGMLLYTGRPVGKPNHLYVFPEEDPSAEKIVVGKEDLLSFREDFESRKNALKGLRNRNDSRSEAEWLSFWQLPKEGQSKPVFYIHHNGHLYFGMSQFLRIGYPHALAEGLPQHHRELAADGRCPLDYPHAILGFAEKNRSYRSRVSVGDLPAEPGAKEMGSVSMILGNPKPGYYPGYVREGKDYTEDDFLLRGYKQYWLKEPQKTEVAAGKERVGTALRPLAPGARFRGVVRFRNLRAEELGLLLWCLRLEPGCFQTLGMGKPYGYGRMRAEITALRILDPAKLYGPDLGASPWRDETPEIGAYIDAYDLGAAQALYWKKPKKRPSLKTRPELEDFFFMKRSLRPAAEAGYMELKEYQNVRAPLPATEDFRTRDAEQRQTAAPSTPAAGDDDPFAALKNRFRGI